MGEILARIVRETGILDEDRQTALQAAWRDVAGSAVARMTRIHSFRGGILVVAVDSAPLRQELTVFQRGELLTALRERFRSAWIEDLRFTLS